tara:strand:+ start:165 stop:1694 length:1530 start_codon:yes stop_codon:yes gene_type:complete
MKKLQDNIRLLLDLFKSKNFKKATKLNKELLDQNPKEAFLYNTMGLILTEQKKNDEAIKFYEKGLEIKPDYAIIYNNLGGIYRVRGDNTKSEEYFLKSVSLDDNIVEPHNNLGNLYSSINKQDKAIYHFKKALKINPNFYISQYNLGVLYKSIGKFDEAINHLEKSIKVNEKFCSAHRVLSQLTRYKKDDKKITYLKKLYLDSTILDNQKVELAFALGKIHEDINDFSGAIDFYNKGNLLRKKNLNFSSDEIKREFNKIKEIFSDKIFKQFDKINSSKIPIFIVGMPRSGTTLVEQIISSHPDVYGGDELNYLPNLATPILDCNEANVNFNTLEHIANEYIKKLKSLSQNSKRVTDKLPINFKWIGLIKLILPNSKVIHCTRNYKDISLSIYKNFFSNPNLNFAYDFNDITNFYNLYLNLMSHWKKVTPNFIYDVNYESLINNPTDEIKKIIKNCNLSWNKKCLKFYDNKRSIKTASDTQARKKIYKSSINSWKNYEKYIGKFINNIGN